MREQPAKFREYDSQAKRATLCLLFTDGGYGEYLGSVYWTYAGWCWDDADLEREGCEPTRRAAKGALQRALKEAGKLG